ncbi:hypothetical protein Pcinc_017969 [Petrolisthes cinctipes]|uniref:Uncharacterized protein n=1 Tax=Petrolisthes cinctipes TaxID=88211 RepID=A0AAE1KPB5_PETCI|nr:hypothetical protein Pcinc_017969 [Petrolisthes cinctipes]
MAVSHNKKIAAVAHVSVKEYKVREPRVRVVAGSVVGWSAQKPVVSIIQSSSVKWCGGARGGVQLSILLALTPILRILPCASCINGMVVCGTRGRKRGILG